MAMYIMCGIACVFVTMLIVVGATMSPERSAAYDQQARVEAACDQMIADSALGSERRMTRHMCDLMKEKAAEDIRKSP
ncbi:hypothetical protein FPJ27_26305 [Burkholderia sp. MS455]|uniref:hypothetical protein n=1 Tax=Burkholderia sp. MS455 TaxID=2811788 RepID=UPI0019592738|nr:hypothetical protein [Burkholderia sp. MS455]QRR09744.1 hypothetical protein FPJ27_26305 [Burkholderia sp. MS455]